MMWDELRLMFNVKPGALDKIRMDDNAAKLRFIEKQSKERIGVAITEELSKNPPARYFLDRVYNHLDQWAYYHGKNGKVELTIDQKIAGQRESINKMLADKQVALDKNNQRLANEIQGYIATAERVIQELEEAK